jgi:hypothetical protein
VSAPTVRGVDVECPCERMVFLEYPQGEQTCGWCLRRFALSADPVIRDGTDLVLPAVRITMDEPEAA